MVVPFLIMFREGLEAALIVAIVAAYLARTGRSDAMVYVWAGIVVAVLGCTAFGIAIEMTASDLPQKVQELFEAGVGAIAAVVLTSMVLWMGRAARSIRDTLHAGIESALTSPAGGRALAALAFFAVAREGLESVLFLVAAYQQMEDVGVGALIGAALGLGTAVVFGLALYRGGRRINLGRFFRWTGVFILFVAAGLVAGALRSLHEAGLFNALQTTAFDLSGVLPGDGLLGTLLSGIFGYRDAPTVAEVGIYLAYLVPALTLFLKTSTVQPVRKAA